MICNDRIKCSQKSFNEFMSTHITLKFCKNPNYQLRYEVEEIMNLYVYVARCMVFRLWNKKKSTEKKTLSFHCDTPYIFTFLSGKLLTSQNKAITPHNVLIRLIYESNSQRWNLKIEKGWKNPATINHSRKVFILMEK